MGREIRRVPMDWDPPMQTDYRGDTGYQPMHDDTYEHVAQKWLEECALWVAGTHPEQLDGYGKDLKYFWEWDEPPDPQYYHPEWPADAVMGYRVYETVSEGTPVSPTFETQEELHTWLLEQGYSETAARKFIEGGWAPSMIMTNDGGRVTIAQNIHALDKM